MPNLSLHIASTEEAVPNLALHVAIIKLVIAYTLLGAKRRDMTARLSFNTACELGFRGSLDEWERLMGAVARR
jgi:hypothetical protein